MNASKSLSWLRHPLDDKTNLYLNAHQAHSAAAENQLPTRNLNATVCNTTTNASYVN